MKYEPMHNCCGDFDRAQKIGTDSEGYGRLIQVYQGMVMMGCDMPEIRFCPWCAAPIKVAAKEASK